MNLNEALSNAYQKMNDPNWMDSVERAAKAHSASHPKKHKAGSKPWRNGGGSGLSELEAQAGFSAAPSAPAPVPLPPSSIPAQASASRNKLLESLKKQPPITGEYDGMSPAVAADLSALGGFQKPMQQMNEAIPQAFIQQAPVSAPVQGIDYLSLVNTIKSCIKEALQETQTLNESTGTLAGLSISGGNKIHLADKKGNIYEATLKLVKKGK